MRQVIAPTAEQRLEVIADDPAPRSAGNAINRYKIHGFMPNLNPSYNSYTSLEGMVIYFQNGPIGPKGPNGVTMETLLAIVADRLTCLQDGNFPCFFNAEALDHVQKAIDSLNARTARVNVTPEQPTIKPLPVEPNQYQLS